MREGKRENKCQAECLSVMSAVVPPGGHSAPAPSSLSEALGGVRAKRDKVERVGVSAWRTDR